VVTELPGLKDSVTEKTIAATEARVTRLTGTLLPPVRCAHDEVAIARALEALIAAPDEQSRADLLLVVVPRRWWTGAMSAPRGSCGPVARSCISACRSIRVTSSAWGASARGRPWCCLAVRAARR